MTAKIYDLQKRACRWCGRPTGSLSVTCKAFACQLRASQARGRVPVPAESEKRLDRFLEDLRK